MHDDAALALCDPAFDPALREDEQVEALEFVWALPTREPQRW